METSSAQEHGVSPGDADDPPDLVPGGEGDRLLAGLAYLFAPISSWIIFWFARRGAAAAYRRYHARQAIVFGLVILVFELILALPDSRLLSAIGFLIPLALQTLLAFIAYTADAMFTIPYLTPLTRRLFPDAVG